MGIDIEFMRTNIELLGIAKRFFSDEENRYIRSQPRSRHRDLFFNCWTRKEAFIKALGSGLTFPLDSFSVQLDDKSGVCLTRTAWDEAARLDWSMLDIEISKSYKAALAVKGKIGQVLRYDWHP